MSLLSLLGIGNQQQAPVTTNSTTATTHQAPTGIATTVTAQGPQTTTFTGQDLAAPVPNNIGAKVISLLAPVANKALQAAHLQGQDLSNASSILNFVSKPLLDQLKGQGSGWEGSKLQSYVSTLVRQLSSIAKDIENNSELALDAVKSIGYITQNLENPNAAQVAFNALLDLSDPGANNLANNAKSQARETENKTSAATLVDDFIKSNPAEAIKVVLDRARSHYNEVGTAKLENMVKAALASPNNQNGQVEIAIMTNLGSYDTNSDHYASNRVGVLEHQSLTLTAIQKGLNQSGVNDAKLTAHLTKLQQGLNTKITDLKA